MPKTVAHYEKAISLFIDTYHDSQNINDALSEVVLESSRKGQKDIAYEGMRVQCCYRR
jgi:hypothetical protein